ncbi:V-type proton ATPase subunit G 1 isoform X2 [Chanos chanos]|uniref:V-type proton ATPase subunit G 1 isoform X2 n=1 Tax=Chanos chanos TaxID=29144 RepID=A0A6J2V001_CHACN|nr:V-type proton ATPase subunit G 1 isoform X2 [Chanos chanos]
MASQSQGIQQLLQAEKRAAEKVAEARKRKNRRLKQETLDKMSRIQNSYQQNREAVLANLLKMVCDIKPEIHANYRVAG